MYTSYCAFCDRQTELITVKEACAIMNKSRSTVYNWINAGNLHLHRTPGGRLLICRFSLVQPYAGRKQAAL